MTPPDPDTDAMQSPGISFKASVQRHCFPPSTGELPRAVNSCVPALLVACSRKLRRLAALSVGMMAALSVGLPPAFAAGEINQLETSHISPTPLRYEISGVTYQWGAGGNEQIDALHYQGRRYQYQVLADRVELVRVDRAGVTDGEPCGVFAERTAAYFSEISPDYPSDGSDSGNCDIASMLEGRIINRGALDIFTNTGPKPKNIERVDYVFDTGVVAPYGVDGLDGSGHVVAEKRGNNPLQVAAITAIDADGVPSAYGPLVMVHAAGSSACAEGSLCYGVTNIRHNYSFFQSDSLQPQGYAEYLKDTTESVAMAFVSTAALGLEAGQRYFGFSLFPRDVDSTLHDLLDPQTFPSSTADDYIVPGDGADIYGGTAAWFVLDSMPIASGSVFFDQDFDGIFDSDESGIPGVSLSLYQEIGGDGALDPSADRLLNGDLESDAGGRYDIAGLAPGQYWLLLDVADADIPAGLRLPFGSENPRLFTVDAGVSGNLNFAFTGLRIDEPDTLPETTTGGGADGTATGGGADGTATGGGADGTATGGGADGTATGGGADGATTGGGADGAATGGGADGAATGGGADGTATGGGADGTATGGGADGTATGGGADGTATGGGADGTATGGGADGTATGGGADGTATGGGADGTATGGGADGTATGGGADGTATGGGADGTATGGGMDGTATGGGSTGGIDGGFDDDGGPVANPDSFMSPQGEDAIMDVLVNDTDPLQQGLDIVAITGVENGDASIITTAQNEKRILLSPDYGFFGVINFLYTVEDGAGTQATGTVSLDVQRFSDINRNGLNDFDECNCDNLGLITGLDGAGVGQVHWLVVLLLGSIVFWRRSFVVFLSANRRCIESNPEGARR